MKCANCGAELKVGSIYCYVCGKEAQIVSDYNLLEDDFLRAMLKEKEEKIAKETERANSEKEKKDKNSSKTNASPPAKKGNRRIKKRLVFAVLAMILLVVLITAIILFVNHRRDNSYDYQMGQAKAYQDEGNYREAEKCVKRAIELDSDSLEAQLFLADIYLLRGEERQALDLLQQLCEENKDKLEIYQRLIQIYDKRKDYESICALSEGTENVEILELFEEYIPETPEFNIEEGVYTEALSIEILAEADCDVYYTLDGSDPKQGQKYQIPIEVEPGQKAQIRAVACNQYRIYSEEEEGDFQVELQKPETPRVTPSGGNFITPQNISVVAPDGCKVYYTWDGTDPTTASKQYTQPIAMPEGNNILSLILVDQYGMRSDVLRCNYIYLP